MPQVQSINKTNPLISIIVPVYNVEPYLKRCFDSILAQTYTNIEIILIDDGSTDASPHICNEYANKDNRIKVVHKKNGGQSEARNQGIDICKGDYISFVDSDDWVEPTYIEELLDPIKKEDADISICQLKRTSFFEKIDTPQEKHYQYYTPYDAIRRLFVQKEVSFIGPVCKIYKRSLFETVRFPVGKFHEDEFIMHILFSYAKKIVCTSAVLYYYYQRADSTMGTPHPYDLLEAEEKQFDFILNNDMVDLQPSHARLICWQILYIYSIKPDICYKAKLRYYRKYLKAQDNPIFHFFLLKMFCHIPCLYTTLRKISPFRIRK